jgi:hypothetical protein
MHQVTSATELLVEHARREDVRDLARRELRLARDPPVERRRNAARMSVSLGS